MDRDAGLLAIRCAVGSVYAMSNMFVLPEQVPLTSAGKVYPGAKAFFYRTGTNTPKATYSDAALTTPHAQPVVADAGGSFPPIFLDTSDFEYRVTINTSADVLIYTQDNVGADTFTQADFDAFFADTDMFPQTAAETAAGVTATEFSFQPQNPHPKRYGALGNSNGTAGNGTNDTVAITAARNANVGLMVDGGGLSYRVSVTLPSPSVPAGFHLWNGEIVSDQMVTTQDEYSVTVFGKGALMANTYIPEQHAASGGRFFASGNHIVAIGREALKANTTGRRQVGIGSRCLQANTTGFYNTFVGSHCAESLTTGFENSGLGEGVMQAAVNATGNAAVGMAAMSKCTSGSNNSVVGYNACGTNSAGAFTGNFNCAIGYRAIYVIESGLDNIGIGRDALVGLTSGSNNVAIGSFCLQSVVGVNGNTAVGYGAGMFVTSANNSMFGHETMDAVTTGTQNSGFGFQVATAGTTIDNTCGFGHRALFALTTGDNNVGMGRLAGQTITTGANNTMIGDATDTTAASSNSTSLGAGATCTGDNQITLGNASIATIRAQVTTITALSDERDKYDIEDLGVGLEFIKAVRPVRFKWHTREKKRESVKGSQDEFRDGAPAKYTDTPEPGVIAQQLLSAQQRLGADWLGLVDTSNPDRLEATPGKLLFVLIKAVQELSAEVDRLKGGAASVQAAVR